MLATIARSLSTTVHGTYVAIPARSMI